MCYQCPRCASIRRAGADSGQPCGELVLSLSLNPLLRVLRCVGLSNCWWDRTSLATCRLELALFLQLLRLYDYVDVLDQHLLSTLASDDSALCVSRTRDGRTWTVGARRKVLSRVCSLSAGCAWNLWIRRAEYVVVIYIYYIIRLLCSICFRRKADCNLYAIEVCVACGYRADCQSAGYRQSFAQPNAPWKESREYSPSSSSPRVYLPLASQEYVSCVCSNITGGLASDFIIMYNTVTSMQLAY